MTPSPLLTVARSQRGGTYIASPAHCRQIIGRAAAGSVGSSSSIQLSIERRGSNGGGNTAAAFPPPPPPLLSAADPSTSREAKRSPA